MRFSKLSLPFQLLIAILLASSAAIILNGLGVGLFGSAIVSKVMQLFIIVGIGSVFFYAVVSKEKKPIHSIFAVLFLLFLLLTLRTITSVLASSSKCVPVFLGDCISGPGAIIFLSVQYSVFTYVISWLWLAGTVGKEAELTREETRILVYFLVIIPPFRQLSFFINGRYP